MHCFQRAHVWPCMHFHIHHHLSFAVNVSATIEIYTSHVFSLFFESALVIKGHHRASLGKQHATRSNLWKATLILFDCNQSNISKKRRIDILCLLLWLTVFQIQTVFEQEEALVGCLLCFFLAIKLMFFAFFFADGGCSSAPAGTLMIFGFS